ncbi:ABC transporter ATP-binding protein [Microvirga alba]|uniref:ABC transporter ATP-binding protein n=1 Tax=Microvirga alba TaxID=2791025 RepID=A0A931FP67_9HYPH|nr:ABC transporter ATP-binding protein [Microvirga alba]MBF9234425.1 ABC transporter ATP-binding protein [Microvirga alba]
MINEAALRSRETDLAVDPLASPASEPLLRVENLSIRFDGAPKGINVVDDVSFSLAKGKTLCIVGESGCGKSVTALALMGLLPTPPARIVQGTAHFEGKDLLGLTERERADLRGNSTAMIFQEPMTSLNPAFTVGDQIAEGILRHRKVSKTEAWERALEMLRRVRIPAPEKRLRAYPHELSGGMRQRVMIAMALANDPQLLIADEPTTALDVTIQAQIISLIRRLQEESGMSMILITHDLGVVAEIADEVVVMYAGRVVESGSVEAIFEDPQHPYTIGLMGSVPSLGRRQGRLATIRGSVPPAELMPKGCRFTPRCPFAESRCATEPPPLVEATPKHHVRCWYAPLEQHRGAVS